MQVRGKTLRCFSVILAFSKSLHETCRLLRALHTFLFLQAVYLGLTLCAAKQYVNLQFTVKNPDSGSWVIGWYELPIRCIDNCS